MAHPIREVASGILFWSASHPNLGEDVSSYYLTGPRVLLNPIMPPDGLDWFLTGPPPAAVILTNHHHRRSTRELAERFGIPVFLCEPGIELFEDPTVRLQPFAFGDTVLDGITAHHVADAWPDETALFIPDARALAVADAVMRVDGELAFVPEQYMDDPDVEGPQLREGVARLVDELDFDHLLLAHGEPVLNDGRDRLRALLSDAV
jgi:glyoxylase-like metal-dependent hydrolase (beta-lactamase superfamily II)